MQAVRGRPAQAPPPPPALVRFADGVPPSSRRPPCPAPPRHECVLQQQPAVVHTCLPLHQVLRSYFPLFLTTTKTTC